METTRRHEGFCSCLDATLIIAVAFEEMEASPTSALLLPVGKKTRRTFRHDGR